MTHGQGTDALTAAAGRLTTRYGERLPAEQIRRVLDETYRALLARATITAYLPVLAERVAAARLARALDGPDALESLENRDNHVGR